MRKATFSIHSIQAVVLLITACSKDVTDPNAALEAGVAGAAGKRGEAGSGTNSSAGAGAPVGIGGSAGVTLDAGSGGWSRAGAVGTTDVAGSPNAFSVTGTAGSGTGKFRVFDVVTTFREPMTQPNDTIFTGSFTFDTTNQTVTDLSGSLTQAMTKVDGKWGGPMTANSLKHQLSSTPVNLGGVDGWLVASFALETVDTFTGGGFVPGGTQYFGLQEQLPNNRNAYVIIFVNRSNPTAAPDQSQLDKLAYADCTEGGLMGSTCMTGTTVAGYGRSGTMGGYPFSQVVTER